MSYFNLNFRVDFLGYVKNVIINILFFTVYLRSNLRFEILTLGCSIYGILQGLQFASFHSLLERIKKVKLTRFFPHIDTTYNLKCHLKCHSNLSVIPDNVVIINMTEKSI